MRRFAVLLLASASACVTTAQEGEQMRQDIAALRGDLKKEIETANAERKKLADEQAARNKALQEALDQLSRAARKSGADLAVDLEKAQNELAAHRGQMEVLQHRLDSVEKVAQENGKLLEAANQLVQQQKREAEHPSNPGALYELAKQRLDHNQPAKARELFGEFLQKFPKDELAANAQYWIGETYYAEKRWNDAIVEFQRVIKEYKQSDKVPDALVKIGSSFQAQGDCANALLFFDEVQQSHKSSQAAKTARDKAAACKKGHTATARKRPAKT